MSSDYVKALNGKSERKLILDAEGEWEVESKPEWCTLSAMSGNKKTELTLTLESGTSYREGEIIFRLRIMIIQHLVVFINMALSMLMMKCLFYKTIKWDKGLI